MREKGKRIRKNIMVNPDLVERARKIFGAANDSLAIEQALNISTAGRKTEDELWEATKNIVKMMAKYKIKPLFT